MPNQFTDSCMAHIDCPNVPCVYRLVHTPTGQFYIGSTKKLRTRISGHFHEMRTGRRKKSAEMCALYAVGDARDWSVEILEICANNGHVLRLREQHYIDQLQPQLNISPSATAPMLKGTKLAEAARQLRSMNAKKLWADPEFRRKHKKSCEGKMVGPKGYKCTPEQVENRRRAARISNMKRNYGDSWKAEYTARYPEYAGDVDA